MGSFGQVDLFSQYLYLFFIHTGFVTALAFEHEEFWGGELGLISAIPGQSLCAVVQMYLLSTVCWLVRSWWNKRKKSPSLLHWAGTWSTACWLIRSLHYRLLETGKKLYFLPMSLLKHPPLAAISGKMLGCGALISLAKFAADLGKLKIRLALTFSSLDWHGSCSVNDLIQMEFLLRNSGCSVSYPLFSCQCRATIWTFRSATKRPVKLSGQQISQ